MNRLEQDAADSLAAHEAQAAFRAAVKARWARAQSGAMTGKWLPPALTEQQKQEFEQYRIANFLPF